MAKSKKKMTLVFTGSYVDGLRDPEGEFVNLAKWAGLDLDEDQSDVLCETTSDIAIVERCKGAIIDEEEHDSDMPSQSDMFIEVRTHDVDALRREVARFIRKIVNEG